MKYNEWLIYKCGWISSGLAVFIQKVQTRLKWNLILKLTKYTFKPDISTWSEFENNIITKSCRNTKMFMYCIQITKYIYFYFLVNSISIYKRCTHLTSRNNIKVQSFSAKLCLYIFNTYMLIPRCIYGPIIPVTIVNL